MAKKKPNHDPLHNIGAALSDPAGAVEQVGSDISKIATGTWPFTAFGGSGSKDSGGDSSGPDPTKNLDMIIRDELQRQYPGAPVTPQQVEYIKAQLAGEGYTAEKTTAKDYRSQVNQWVQKNTGAQQYFNQYNPFGQGQQSGQLTPAVLAQMLKLTQQYQKPYLDEMRATSAQMAAELKQAIPGLPAPFKSLVQAYEPVYERLGGQMADSIAAADPGLIANAYMKYYNAPAAATNSLSSLQGLSSLMTPSPPPKGG